MKWQSSINDKKALDNQKDNKLDKKHIINQIQLLMNYVKSGIPSKELKINQNKNKHIVIVIILQWLLKLLIKKKEEIK